MYVRENEPRNSNSKSLFDAFGRCSMFNQLKNISFIQTLRIGGNIRSNRWTHLNTCHYSSQTCIVRTFTGTADVAIEPDDTLWNDRYWCVAERTNQWNMTMKTSFQNHFFVFFFCISTFSLLLVVYLILRVYLRWRFLLTTTIWHLCL